jgi:hypothetical protein
MLHDIIFPAVFEELEGSDKFPLVLRTASLVLVACFDATAPYHPTAVGKYSRLPRQPAAKMDNNEQVNIACAHASYHALLSLYPIRKQTLQDMLRAGGLDPNNDNTEGTSPVALGNKAGIAVVRGCEHDGLNQLGKAGRQFNPMPYMDYTGYTPVNTAKTLSDPSRWQPGLVSVNPGNFAIERFITPQLALTEPSSFKSPKEFKLPPPLRSNHRQEKLYKEQVDEVLKASADLDEDKKLLTELFERKGASLGSSQHFAAVQQGYSMLEYIQVCLLANVATFDAAIVVWQEKRRYDSVRPFSAISFAYGTSNVTAWGGPGVGTTTLPANQWKSYLRNQPHPEYPSGSACFCAAQAQAIRRFTGTDELNFEVHFPKGSSTIEPGITPTEDVRITIATWTEFELLCGESRVWGGVHFQAAVDEALELCPTFGDLALEYVQSLINGTAPIRPPAQLT